MAFVGYIAAVIAKKTNDARKERRKASFQQKVSYHTKLYKTLVDHKKMSPTEFSSFKKRLQQKNTRSTIKNIVLVLLSVIVTLVLVYNFLEYIK